MSHEGAFIISLDFELFWGVRDSKKLSSYKNNILGVQNVIPEILKIFDKYKIKVTFAIVGLLFCRSKKEIISFLPEHLPEYKSPDLIPIIDYLSQIGNEYNSDPYHYAPIIINKIMNYPEHEIGSHTFAHYYCLEDGQNKKSFKYDLISAIKIAKSYDIKLKSLIFPRNQINKDYLEICKELGFITIRGNQKSWLYRRNKNSRDHLLKRALRLLDSYINISGYNCYSIQDIKREIPINIPSSRFLRPFSKRMKFMESLKLRRIKNEMTYAAKHNMAYHLWWHPHNFGININENLEILENILDHYNYLRINYNYKNYTMKEIAEKLYEK